MTARRGASGLAGILLIDKESGPTSHDVVNAVRRISGERRVGHAGTLDPLATGLLVVLVGPATRLAPYLTAADKRYEATVVFGSETDTDDAEGVCSRTAPVPPELASPDCAAERVRRLLGVHEQVPPAYSALKIDGEAAYLAARSGRKPDLAPRRIEILDADLLGVDAGPPVTWRVALQVSKGTYLRAIARDLGRSLGSAAHLGALRRTQSGSLRVDRAYTLSELESRGPGGIETCFADPLEALGMTVLELTAEEAHQVADGRRVAMRDVPERDLPDGPVAMVHGGHFLAVYVKEGGHSRAAVVIPGGIRIS